MLVRSPHVDQRVSAHAALPNVFLSQDWSVYSCMSECVLCICVLACEGVCVLWCTDLFLTLVPPSQSGSQARPTLPDPHRTTSALHKHWLPWPSLSPAWLSLTLPVGSPCFLPTPSSALLLTVLLLFPLYHSTLFPSTILPPSISLPLHLSLPFSFLFTISISSQTQSCSKPQGFAKLQFSTDDKAWDPNNG